MSAFLPHRRPLFALLWSVYFLFRLHGASALYTILLIITNYIVTA